MKYSRSGSTHTEKAAKVEHTGDVEVKKSLETADKTRQKGKAKCLKNWLKVSV